jgi:ribosomal protein S6--L-glutamate ligase
VAEGARRKRARALRIAIVTAYPREDWHSTRLLAAARRHGHAVTVAPERLWAHVTRSGVVVRAGAEDVREFDAFLMPRALGEAGDEDFQLAVYRLMVELGCVLVNDLYALLAALDKFRSAVLFQRAGLPTPPQLVVQEPGPALRALRTWHKVVVKPLCGSLGDGVELLEHTNRASARLRELLGQHRALCVQPYIGGKSRDIRAFVIGDRVAAAVCRHPKKGEFRGNAWLGARLEPARLEPATERVAVAAAQAVGLAYTGVDLIEGAAGPVVLEVNGTPRWEALYQATGRDLAEDIVAHALSLRDRRGSTEAARTPLSLSPERSGSEVPNG